MKNQSKPQKEKTVDKLVSKLHIPEDVVLGNIIITINGNNTVFIENYKGISHYNSEKIIVNGKKNNITIYGKNLNIQYFSDINMKIKGKIDKIELS